MATVYIIQQPKPNAKGWMPDFTDASKYGKFRFIFAPGERPWTDPEAAMETASVTLANFNADEDYILWPCTGDPAALFAVLLILGRFPINQVTFLYWERKIINGHRNKSEGFYTPVKFNLR